MKNQNQPKLTKVQQAMYDRLMAGKKIYHINRFAKNGGRYVWNIETEELAHYKVFWNLMRVLKLNASEYLIQSNY